MLNNEKIKVINFLQDFGCATLEQLQILFDKPKDNTLYHIIASGKNDEKGVLKLLRINAPSIPEADKFIFLFQDSGCFEKLECGVPYIYCVYPGLRIINK